MILIIDNYDSFTYNLVHLVAEHTDVYKVVRNDAITIDEIAKLQPTGIVISPGPGRPSDAGITADVIRQFGKEIPILGVCLGHQAIGEVFGGEVVHAPKLMHGKTSTIHHDGKGVFEGIEDGFTATRYHSLVLKPDHIPAEFDITARSEDDVIMGIRHKEYSLEGIQFHPESLLTTAGKQLLANWIAICRKQIELNRSLYSNQ
ncbi:MAG: aminodeoxychorismate/anthranilate synthase component II [Balneolaceae bacterium]|nr:aminodeoxychorismate/anthranilate synthase component II [Balneolaceae bacterium]